MPYKQKLIDFMKAKADYLPPDVRNIYFIESDIEAIINGWTSIDAEIVCKTMALNIDTDKIYDSDLCPFCIQADSHCNRCGYFQNHGVCTNGHSDYAKIIASLYGDRESCCAGIMEYIIGLHGVEALMHLRKILDPVPLKKAVNQG